MTLDAPLLGVAALLEGVEAAPESEAGALAYCLPGRPRGFVFVENRRVCWAIAAGNDGRLTELLLAAAGKAIDRSAVEAVYDRCRVDGANLGEALLASGLIDGRGLSQALFRHTSESVAALVQHGAAFPEWVPHRRGGFAPRFTFAAADVLTDIGAARHASHARQARAELARVVRGGSTAVAYVRSAGAGVPEPVAARGTSRLTPALLLQIGRRAADVLDLTGFVDPRRELAVVTLDDGRHAIAWSLRDLVFAALCEDAALLPLRAAAIRRAKSPRSADEE